MGTRRITFLNSYHIDITLSIVMVKHRHRTYSFSSLIYTDCGVTQLKIIIFNFKLKKITLAYKIMKNQTIEPFT